ncbi:MAG: glycosyltransferase family 4 protein, partial [Vicinamibacterales bacterium]
LYRSADICVFPYRAEGVCLPIVEAMACGTPAIVPQFGAALDFCNRRTSVLLPVRRINVPVGRSFAINTLGFEQQIDEVDFCEVSVDTLAAALTAAVATPPAVRRRLGHASRRMAQQFSWASSVKAFDRAVAAMLAQPVPVRFKRQRLAQREHPRVLAAARALYLLGSPVAGHPFGLQR